MESTVFHTENISDSKAWREDFPLPRTQHKNVNIHSSHLHLNEKKYKKVHNEINTDENNT